MANFVTYEMIYSILDVTTSKIAILSINFERRFGRRSPNRLNFTVAFFKTNRHCGQMKGGEPKWICLGWKKKKVETLTLYKSKLIFMQNSMSVEHAPWKRETEKKK